MRKITVTITAVLTDKGFERFEENVPEIDSYEYVGETDKKCRRFLETPGAEGGTLLLPAKDELCIKIVENLDEKYAELLNSQIVISAPFDLQA